MVASGDCIALTLRGPSAEANVRRSIDVKLIRCFGENDGANVPAFHHNITIIRVSAHFCDKDFANTRDAANERNFGVHRFVTEMWGGIEAVNRDPGRVAVEIAIEARSLEQARNGVTITRRDSVLQYMPGYSAIHGAGIHIIETDLFREHPRDAALAGRSRAIDRNDLMNGRDTHIENRCGWFHKIAGNLSTFATQAVGLPAFILRLFWSV